MDNAYINEKMDLEEDDAKNGGKPLIIGKDRKSGSILVHEVEQKGRGDGWLVRRLLHDLEDFGYISSRVVMKTDQEPAVTDDVRHVVGSRGHNVETVMVHSPV